MKLKIKITSVLFLEKIESFPNKQDNKKGKVFSFPFNHEKVLA